jgi:ATP-binding cassette subfamily B protein
MTGLAFDEVLKPDPNTRNLLVIALAILAVVLVRGVVDLANSFSVETLAQRLERDAREELAISLLGKSQTFHNRQRVGDIMARATNDIRQLNPMINPGVALISESLVGIVVPLIFIASIRFELLLAPSLFIVGFWFALRHYMRQLNPVSGAMRHQFGVMNAGLTETILGIEVVKSSAQEAQEKKKFFRDAHGYRDYFVKQGKIQARYLPLLLLGIALSGAFAHGLLLLSRGELSIGSLVAYMGLMGVLRFPAFISIFTFSLVQLGLAGARRILSLIDEETELDENRAGHTATIRGEIVFDRVSFVHEDDPIKSRESQTAALRKVSFRIEPGTTLAIVGQTGSGKSTLTKLVNRIFDVSEGKILVDGVDVRDWQLEVLRSQISVIEQDVFLFSRSIAENIAFGLGQAVDPPAVKLAAQAAQAHGFIEDFQDGYDTVIGERGLTLSGGQRQRIAIAEDQIQQAINRVLEGRTTLLITHRLSQIRRADKILVLHHGGIVDQGTHEELLERCGLYRRIFAHHED